MRQPSTTDLALIAAKLDPKLPPDEAATRARAIWEALDRHIRADEIADAEEEEHLKAEGERLERVGLGFRCDEISLSQASEIARQIASKLRVTPYKTEQGFAEAMRAAKLTSHRIYYGKTLREWIESDECEMPIARTEEYTSAKAVEELYRMKAEARRKKDRAREAAKKVKERAKNKSRKSSAERKSGTAEEIRRREKQSPRGTKEPKSGKTKNR